jgi:hypothetical protein
MIHKLIDALTRAKDDNRLRDAFLKLAQDNERLRLKVAQLQSENRQLRRRLHDAELRLLRRAEADALLVGALHFADLPTSRRACAEVGLGHRRWVRAQALLKLGRVVDGRRIVTDAPEDFERAVRVATEKVKKQGIEALRHRMPLSRQ